MGHSDNSHRVTTALPTDGMAVAESVVDVLSQRVERKVHQTVMFPIVRHVNLYLFIIGRVWPTGQREVFVRSTYRMGKLLRRIPGSQQKDPLGRGHVVRSIVGQHVVTHNTFLRNHIKQRHSHRTLRRRGMTYGLLIMRQASSDIYCREVDRVSSQDMFRLDSGQHGISPTELRLPLILDRRHR